MDSELIMKSDVLDILFEKRNKAYGAYRLRKFYKNRLIRSLALMIAAVIVFSAFTFIPGKVIPSGDLIVTEQGFSKILPAAKIPELKPKPIKPVNITRVPTLKFLSNIIMVGEKDSADILHNLNNGTPGSNTDIPLSTNGAQLIVPVPAGNEPGIEPVKIIQPPLDKANPVDNPEIRPEYPGGIEALRKFLARNLTNPRDLEEGELISVKVKFVVGYDGKLQRFELVQDGGSEFNNEVIRVLKKMPAWIPGRSKGQNIPVFYVIPVKFIRED